MRDLDNKKDRNMRQVFQFLSLVIVFTLLLPVSKAWGKSDVREAADSLENAEESEQVPDHGVLGSEDERKKGLDAGEGASVSGKWKSRDQKYFYYENGKKTVGLKQISGKYYYFDPKGIQRTGWQLYNGAYYFFKIANGEKGYMKKSATINGVKLGIDGKAELTAVSSKKLNILIRANKIMEKAVRPAMSKSEKLEKAFAYLLAHYQYRGEPQFVQSECWELDYAGDMFAKGHGNCYSYGAVFAFLANAAGYNNCYAVSSGGHGWAEVAGKVYDPSWSLIDKDHDYFGVSFQLSGVDGRPNYRNVRKYVVKI